MYRIEQIGVPYYDASAWHFVMHLDRRFEYSRADGSAEETPLPRDPARFCVPNPEDAVPKTHDSKAIKILVVEDNEKVREQICQLLTRHPGFDVVCEAENGLEGIRLAQEFQPDVIVLDVTMPVQGGIEAATRIRRVAPKARIVFLSQHSSLGIEQAALAAGGQAYVVKSSAAADLIQAVEAVVEGRKFGSKVE
jgi:CheY-like chemotaxis protein